MVFCSMFLIVSLDRLGVLMNINEDKCESNLMPIIVGVVVGVIVVAVIILVVLLLIARAKKQKQRDQVEKRLASI